MTLPVSSYEELLNRVRCLTNETRQLQRQIDAPLLDHNENESQVNNSASAAEWVLKPRSETSSTLDPAVSTSPQSISSSKSCTKIIIHIAK
ncbi:hypothetical protein O3M35_010546 [Rhynocoris fuscipes]|uniref:Uncharacterized protein n=1 Tax=Rhynocoris fuscipes TaxID=488301 RepID=A0AAW1D0S6_9HEMI